MYSIKTFMLLLLFCWPLAGQAAAMDKLKTFIANTHSAQANFTQELLDKNGKRLQSASGTLQFMRPGKFRWVYQKPYAQIIVGDGKKFWLYDPDLNQVTVKELDAALGNSPAALLSGSNEIERGFILKNRGESGHLDWLEAMPKGNETSFTQILMAFNAQADLVSMELHDTYGHRTLLQFSALKRNPSLSADNFRFVPPAGADVLADSP